MLKYYGGYGSRRKTKDRFSSQTTSLYSVSGYVKVAAFGSLFIPIKDIRPEILKLVRQKEGKYYGTFCMLRGPYRLLLFLSLTAKLIFNVTIAIPNL